MERTKFVEEYECLIGKRTYGLVSLQPRVFLQDPEKPCIGQAKGNPSQKRALKVPWVKLLGD
jgi:hypothetical protein